MVRVESFVPFLITGFGHCASLPDILNAKPSVNLPLPARTVAQLNSTPTWLENIAVRANGDLLVTQLTPDPVLYTIRDPAGKNAILEPVYQWNVPNVAKLLGVAETSPDNFVIVAGNATDDASGYAGTFSVWEARFPSLKSSKPEVRKVANIPEAKFLNGIVPVPGRPEIVLIADSQYGLVFRLDTRTGTYEVIADRPEFKPHPELQNATVGFGINGVKVRDGYLYFSNSNFVKIFCVQITPDGYIAHKGKAPVELYADLNTAAIFVDDFTFAKDGTIWAVSNYGNSVVAVSPDRKKIEEVAGARGQLTVAGDTAAAFGRTKADSDVLYVCTAGGLGAPVNGTVIEPGKVVAVDTSSYTC
ncbi:hypothetical protein IQ06DRAFT_293696 [Phaeosphaeriaceae sp. SRC1lsM3a]|nr:hypothetical protein IQ06DRAFT_293696 [Stagonospora sp. SRC1lsM3a]